VDRTGWIEKTDRRRRKTYSEKGKGNIQFLTISIRLKRMQNIIFSFSERLPFKPYLFGTGSLELYWHPFLSLWPDQTTDALPSLLIVECIQNCHKLSGGADCQHPHQPRGQAGFPD
jgi:hypothetical protein